MKHPEKWRETADPFCLPYRNFTLQEVIGYPHAGNDVFQTRGICQGREVAAFVKVARQRGADIQREIDTIRAIGWDVLPEIIDHDEGKKQFVVTAEKEGERLSTILGDNGQLQSLDYLYEYGQTLARLHQIQGSFEPVKDRSYFHIPSPEHCDQRGLGGAYDYLVKNQPQQIHRCFCHGDFHYANILWNEGHISAILDFELSGLGNKEFDIAWALILRPGQRFLKTETEINRFLDGYRSEGSLNIDYVKYYMVLIYTRFYDVGEGCDGYQDYVRQFCAAVAAEKG